MYNTLRTLIASLPLLTAVLAGPVALYKRQARTPLDPTIYPTLVRYGMFAAAAIPDPCNVPPDGSVVLNYLENLVTDTHATVFRADNTKEIIISYRGSSSVQNFVTDFTFIPVNYTGCTGCEAHLGFYTAYKSIADASTAALSAALAANPGYTTTIVGHSLGGAIAALAYTSLKPQSQYKVGEAWSYGQPRVGNPALSDYIDSIDGASDTNIGTFKRVTHANDGVPLLPSQDDGYEHSRTELWVNDNSTGVPSAATAYRCYGKEAPDCIDGQGGVFINAAHISYPGINYATACT